MAINPDALNSAGEMNSSKALRTFTPQLTLIDYRNYSSSYFDKLKIKKANSKVIRFDKNLRENGENIDENKQVIKAL